MSTTPPPVPAIPKPRGRWKEITARVLVVVFVLWVGFVGFMWRAVYRSPEGCARVMSHLPWEVFLIRPFEIFWTQARGCTVQVGDPSPASSLSQLDDTGGIRLGDLNQAHRG